MSVKKFHKIFEFEVAAITERRKKYRRPPITLEQEGQERDGTPVLRPASGSNVVGLALSGGGIRSAAFCLGAMQALSPGSRHVDALLVGAAGGAAATGLVAGKCHYVGCVSSCTTGEEGAQSSIIEACDNKRWNSRLPGGCSQER